MPPRYSEHILAASQAGDRVSLLNDMRPESVYQHVKRVGVRSAPTVDGWLGAMRPDRVAAALTSRKPQQDVAVVAVRALNTVQGPAAVAEMLVAANLPRDWADDLLGAIGPMAAAEVLEHGRKHGRTWVRLLRPDLLTSIALAVDAARTALLLEHAFPGQVALTLPKLPPYRAIPILANLGRSAVADCLDAIDPKRAAWLLGLGTWRVRLNMAFGAVSTNRSRNLRVTLGPVVRANLLAQASPDVTGRVLAEMSSTVAADLLATMPADLVRQIDADAPDRTLAWLCATRPGTAIEILSVLDSGRAANVLTALPSRRAVRLLAMTRAETLIFEADCLRDELEHVAAAARWRQGWQLLEALGQALRHAWRLLTALRIAEAEPMAVLMHPTALNLWQGLDPQTLERLRAYMSDLALRRLLQGSGNR